MPLVLALGCTAYDAGLLATYERCGDGELQAGEACDVNIATGEPGACPERCSSTNPCAPKQLVGVDCDLRCESFPVTAAKDGDGCCLGDLDPDQDSDCGFCGDGVIDRGETCDPIESCPTPQSCAPADECHSVRYLGDAATCTAECVASPIEVCNTGDGCCPAHCTPRTDADCSSQCGDGQVDRDAGETCEPGSMKAACPESCDDRDPCTLDLTRGSPENCNVACTHLPITQPLPDDGCCVTDSAAGTDPDCKPECDGGGTTCTALGSAQQDTDASQQCHAILAKKPGKQTETCTACACRECADAMLGCYASDDPQRDEHCIPLFECSADSDCWGDNCYCGVSSSCLLPDGPCRRELEAAALTPSRAAVEQCAADPACASYRSRQYRECLRRKCDSECN